MRGRLACGLILGMIGFIGGIGPICAQAEFRDDFSTYAIGSEAAPQWETETIAWAVAPGGRYVVETKGRTVALYTKAPRGRVMTIEATLRITASVSEGWKIAGVVLQDDERNFWHLALVESPEAEGARRFIELQEAYEGQWLAPHAEATRLTMIENRSFEWEKDHPYRLRLELTGETIVGTVAEWDGTVRGRVAFRLDNPRAVKEGQAGLDAGGFRAEFSDFYVSVKEAAPPKPQPVVTYPPCDVKGYSAVRAPATGFFYVKQIGGRWWLITPQGEGFWALGTDHVNYHAHWCEKLGYAPYHRNCEAKYGNEEAWAEAAAARLKAWNFNALGVGWSAGMKYRGLPRCEFLSFGSGFAALEDICPQIHWTGFPNVFSPKWPLYCEKRAKAICGRLKDDPWIIGYFLDNELEWFGKNGQPWGLFDECMKKPAGHSAKEAALAFLKARYSSVAALNAAWGTRLADWEALAQATSLTSHTERANRDRLDFVRLIAERYFSVTNAAMKKYDPHHLNLGCRFAGFMPPGVIEIAGKYCDIVSVNFYGQVDLERSVSPDMPRIFADYAKRCRRPMMITEWSFPAYDSGLPCEHGAGQRVATQAERARCYEIYQTALMAMPFLVGSNYFMWVDEPALGISSTFPEDSNYGLVDEQDRPWPDLTQTAMRVNARVYEIHSGRTPEIRVEIAADGRSVFVQNRGGAGAKFVLHLWCDGRRQLIPLSVPAGGKKEIAVAGLNRTPGGHFVLAEADPEGALAETERSDNKAQRIIYIPGAQWPAAISGKARQRLPLIIANPTDRALRNLTWTQPLPGFVAGIVLTASGQPVPYQFDGTGPNAEISLRVGDLPPYSCGTFFLYPSESGPRDSGEAPAVEAEIQPEGFVAQNELLTIEHKPGSSDLLSHVTLGDLQLGRFVALLHQELTQHLWVAPDRTEQIVCRAGPVRFVADITVAATRGGPETKTAVSGEGEYAPQQARPHRYRACYRLSLSPGEPCFGSRLLWIENTDTEPWRLASYYHYAPSDIGDDAAHDMPAKRLPAGVVAWTNAQAGGVYGCIGITSDDFKMTFWRDPGGGQHPDVWRDVQLTLKPGQRYETLQPTAVFFGARDISSVGAIAAQARASRRLLTRLLSAEARHP